LKFTVEIGIERGSLVDSRRGVPFAALGLAGAFAGICKAEERKICWKLNPALVGDIGLLVAGAAFPKDVFKG